MRGRILLGGLFGLVLLSGCGPARTQIRPPVTKEEFREPPTADARYATPPQYPKSVLMQAPVAKMSQPMQQGGGPQQTGFQQPGQ